MMCSSPFLFQCSVHSAQIAVGSAQMHTSTNSFHLFVRIKYKLPQIANVTGTVINNDAAIEQHAKQITNCTLHNFFLLLSSLQSSISNINHKINGIIILNESAFPDQVLTRNHHSLLVPAESSAV